MGYPATMARPAGPKAAQPTATGGRELKPVRPRPGPEFARWMRTTAGVKLDQRTRVRYENLVPSIKSQFENSAFWRSLVADLSAIDEEYRATKGYPLLHSLDAPRLLTKPYESLLDKLYRRNVLGSSWPDPPTGGWLTPENSYDRINDIVRTKFVVRYLDGVEFLAESLRSRCRGSGHASRIDYEAKSEGYYAAHFYAIFPVNVPAPNWTPQQRQVQVELQITTEVQDLIRDLLHKHYEQVRSRETPEGVVWQWEYKSDRFVTNYLGHILHYVEGMIVDVRDRSHTEEDR